MTFREDFVQTLLFGKPDKVPLLPGSPRESTLKAWHQQGLGEGKYYRTEMYRQLGIDGAGMERGPEPDVSFKMIPQFEEKVLEHKDGHYVVQDWMGAVVEISDEFDVTYLRGARDFVTRAWLKEPVETHGDWEDMKKRYNPDTPGRYPEDFDQQCKQLKDRTYPIVVAINGPFWQLREWCGFEGLCMLMVEDPDFVTEMVEFWRLFISKTMERLLENVQVDRMLVHEDMAYKEKCMISPAMTRKFIQPCYNTWVPQIKQSGCPLVELDSDGHIGELIPMWIESGFNVCSPIEVAAGNDIVDYRRQYGKKIAYLGGLDKRSLAAGGQELRDEVLRIVPPLLEEGGFIPGCDHGVPPDISWPNYLAYSKLIAELTGWL